jgi:protein-S-isoprenylcysteine O-methyltransferase Ste14
MRIRKDYNIVGILIILGGLFIPIFSIFMYVTHTRVKFGLAFLVFIFFIALERVWENFFTTKDKKPQRLYGNWTFPLVSAGYIILGIIIITDFYVNNTFNNIGLAILGFCLLCLSIYVRFLSMYVLGKQWSTHAHGVQKVKHVRLVKIGPYKYLRHPIYSSVFLEVFALSLIANSLYGFLCAIFLNVPLQLLRAYVEERASLRRFGNVYEKYIKEVPAFVPYKIH